MNPLAHGVLVGARVKDGQAVQVQIRKGAAHAGRDPGRVRPFDLEAMATLPAHYQKVELRAVVRSPKEAFVPPGAKVPHDLPNHEALPRRPQPRMHVKRASVRDAEQGMEQATARKNVTPKIRRQTPKFRGASCPLFAANIGELGLRAIRESLGMTQNDVAGRIEVDQGQLSRFERGQDMRVSTLRRYWGALGFDLEITAVAGDKRIVIRREHAHR